MISIAIIDSGVYYEHPKLKEYHFNGVSISEKDGKYVVTDDIIDRAGHGTAVTGILCQAGIEADIYIVKVYMTEEMTVEPEIMMKALEYIYENVQCEFILMSLGTPILDNAAALIDICEKLSERGTQIVSAFDNSGCLSYPACIKSVIGVDSADYIREKGAYEIINGDGVIDIRARGGLQRVCWVEPSYRLVTGTSFAAAHAMVSMVSAYEAGARNKEGLLAYLRSGAKRVIEFDKINGGRKSLFHIAKAIVYPFNKEIQTVLRYSDQLTYSITHVCDEPLHGCVGKDADKLLFGTGSKKRTIENIYDVFEYDDFDTVIIGHLRELSMITNKPLLKNILEKCLDANKNVYSFDNVNEYHEMVEAAAAKDLIFSSPVCSMGFPAGRLGRLWVSSKPIIGVFGTSSRQGKFSVQLLLRQIFMEKGYEIAQLGTEPASLIMGMDKIFPLGYDADLPFRNEDAVILLNEMVHEMEMQEPDVVLVGGQSCTIPYDVNHIYDLTFSQWDFIVGTNPDLIVLCVNPQDSQEYISRTIHFLESIGHARVIGLVLFPMQLEQEWYGFSFKSMRLNDDAYNAHREVLEGFFHLPVYRLCKSGITDLCAQIIESLSSDA